MGSFEAASAAFAARAARAGAPPEPLLATALHNLGNALHDAGRSAEGLIAYEKAVATTPPSCLAYNVSSCLLSPCLLTHLPPPSTPRPPSTNPLPRPLTPPSNPAP